MLEGAVYFCCIYCGALTAAAIAASSARAAACGAGKGDAMERLSRHQRDGVQGEVDRGCVISLVLQGRELRTDRKVKGKAFATKVNTRRQ